jgi:hypothetical protein
MNLCSNVDWMGMLPGEIINTKSNPKSFKLALKGQNNKEMGEAHL